MSRFFITRPIAAGVISILLVIAGLVALPMLGIEQTPNITPPTVQVTTSYPGANARVIAETVADPIESQVNGVEDMLYMSSTSSDDGSYALTITFEVGTDIDMATVLVQNRVAIAVPTLPSEVQRQGVTTEKQSTSMVLVLALTSPTGQFGEIYLSNYINTRIKDELSRIPGVGGVTVFGAKDYSMRIWLDPERLRARQLTTNDVVQAIQEQNVQVAAGTIGGPPSPAGQQLQLTINALGRLTDVSQFENIIVKVGDADRVVRLSDVARIELGALSYDSSVRLDGKPSIAVGIYQLPGSNSLDVAQRVQAKMEELSRDFPPGLAFSVPYDTTKFISASIDEVVETLFIAVALVVFTVFVFLQNLRSTLIPAITIPVSLIATLAVMYAIGFSINTLSLFGLVLAIGIVVDDAIIVVENCMRLLETTDMTPQEAALKTMEEVSGPVIATTLVLLAVFVPTAMMGGISGRLYQQFALTIAVSTLFSSLNALTLSPALCSILLKRPDPNPKRSVWGLPLRIFNSGVQASTSAYTSVLRMAIRVVVIPVILFAGIVALTGGGFQTVPTGFIPDEDQGLFFISVTLPDGATLERTQEVMTEIDKIVAETPGVASRFGVTGYGILDALIQPNAGTYFVTLEPWSDRTSQEKRLRTILQSVQAKVSEIRTAVIFVLNPPPIQGLGAAGGFDMRLQDRGNAGLILLQQSAMDLVAAGTADGRVTRMNSNFRANVPQLFVDVDRVKVKKLGVSLEEVFSTLSANLGSQYVNDFNKFNKTYRVMLQADYRFRKTPDDINRLFVRNNQGTMIPMSTLVTVTRTAGPRTVFRYQGYPSATITGVASPGLSSGQAIIAMEQLAAETLPPSIGYQWTGVTYQQIVAGNQAIYIFALAIIFVYLFLCFLYESWMIPLAVMLSVPVALLGGIALTWARGLDNNIYTQIGIILLIGLSAKTAILIVEFAKERREQGDSVTQAALEASRLRFRAILMTAFSFILGVIPLAIATGAGAASRVSLGTVVLGGMTAATVVGIFFMPVLYVVVQWTSEWFWRPEEKGGDTAETPHS
jgi:HAE1 family hydrophobic/amphiphilic exporter-1